MALAMLAAAYAEKGEFDAAIEWQQRALDIAPAYLREDFETRMNLYKKTALPRQVTSCLFQKNPLARCSLEPSLSYSLLWVPAADPVSFDLRRLAAKCLSQPDRGLDG